MLLVLLVESIFQERFGLFPSGILESIFQERFGSFPSGILGYCKLKGCKATSVIVESNPTQVAFVWVLDDGIILKAWQAATLQPFYLQRLTVLLGKIKTSLKICFWLIRLARCLRQDLLSQSDPIYIGFIYYFHNSSIWKLSLLSYFVLFWAWG